MPKNIYVKNRFKNNLSREHLDFFKALEMSHQSGDYFFTHAGIDPEKPLDQQDERDLLWIRGRFLDSRKDFGRVVIHGHTPVYEPEKRKNRIGIDTGAVYGRKITALMLDGERQEFLSIDANNSKTC